MIRVRHWPPINSLAKPVGYATYTQTPWKHFIVLGKRPSWQIVFRQNFVPQTSRSAVVHAFRYLQNNPVTSQIIPSDFGMLLATE